MSPIDKSEIDKIDDPEIKKIVLDAINETDDENEQSEIIDKKLMELEVQSEIKSFKEDPFKPWLTRKAIAII